MKNHKFRGKTLSGKWAYGSLITLDTGCVIVTNNIVTVDNDLTAKDCLVFDRSEIEVVIHETVGQFTGLTDKNGVEIYEGDILRIKSELNNNHNDYPIEFRSGSFVAWCHGDNNGIILHKIKHSDFEVIGNIHDK